MESFATEAEDLIVDRLLHGLLGRPRDRAGFYIDIGAYDPVQSSNTWHFYRAGWCGISVEPNPEVMERFRELRPQDINLNVAIGQAGQTGRYTAFSDPQLNGFLSQEQIAVHTSRHGHSVLWTADIPFQPVESLLSHVPPGVSVDFLNIDVEMMEHEILAAWDFARCRPAVIAVEIHGAVPISGITASPVALLLEANGYVFTSRVWHTSMFVDGAKVVPVWQPGDVIDFRTRGNRAAFAPLGWSQTEEWGTWSDGSEATLSFRWPDTLKPPVFVDVEFLYGARADMTYFSTAGSRACCPASRSTRCGGTLSRSRSSRRTPPGPMC
jgi:FkbM family methyltransferase